MAEDNLIGFGECVLSLHEKLGKYVNQSDLYEELNSMIHKMMDTTAKGRYSMARTSGFSKKFRDTSIIEQRNSVKPKKARSSFNSFSSENRVSDFKVIKPCFVKLNKICDTQLNKLLYKKMYSDKAQSNSKDLEEASHQSTELIHNPNKNLTKNRKIDATMNVNIDPEFLATEEHLDLLMAREMSSSCHQMEKRLKGKVKHRSTNSVKDCSLNPVVLLKRLSPQVISKAINGKLDMESGEFNHIRREKVPPLKRMAVSNEVRRSKRSSIVKLGCSCCSKSSHSGIRRSERLSNISLSSEDKNSFFYRRNSSSSQRQIKMKDDKERISGNKENIPRPKRRSNEKIINSDDEEEFYGFESQTKNRKRLKKMKEALKILNAQPSGKEKRRIIKVKQPLKNVYLRPTGKENGRTPIFNGDFKSLIRHKVPFKAVNRLEGQCSTNGDIAIIKNPNIEDYRSSIRDNDLNVRNQIMMAHRNNAQCKDGDADVSALNRLEILKLFKKREKFIINKMVRDQGKVIVSKTGELYNEDKLLEEPLNYYSGKYYFKKIGRRIPLWAEESIRNVIIKSQDQIPTDIIAGYFQDEDTTDPTHIAEFLGNAFLEKDEIAVTAR